MIPRPSAKDEDGLTIPWDVVRDPNGVVVTGERGTGRVLAIHPDGTTTVVAAELNNGIPGVGGLAYLAGQQLNTPLTIACIIVIGVTALLLDSLIKWIGLLAVPWKGKA